MTRPVVVSVKEADGTGEQKVSLSFFQSNADIPEPNDKTIRKTVIPGGTVYVRLVILVKDDGQKLFDFFSFKHSLFAGHYRSFGGIASDKDALENVKQLRNDLRTAGKEFVKNKFDAAGYDAPWELLYRHNEVWVRAP